MFKKSQATVEFIITLSIFLAIFLSFFVIFQERKIEFDNKEVLFSAKIVAEKVADKINNLILCNRNSTTTTILPSMLDNDVKYNISISGLTRMVEVNYEGKRYTHPILTSNITSIIITSKQILLKKESGRVVVNG